MIYGNTKTKLDYILEHGFMRIDAAVEGVIAKYPTPQAIKIEAKKPPSEYPEDVHAELARQQIEGFRNSGLFGGGAQNFLLRNQAAQGGLYRGSQYNSLQQFALNAFPL